MMAQARQAYNTTAFSSSTWEDSTAPARFRAIMTESETAGTTAAQTATITRTVGVIGLTSIALIHVLDAPGTFEGALYIFGMYMALIAGCLGTAAILLRAHSRQGWTAAAILSAAPFIGFVLSRSTGLPGDTGDIGNWTEQLGMASLFIEACVFAVSLYGLRLLPKQQ